MFCRVKCCFLSLQIILFLNAITILHSNFVFAQEVPPKVKVEAEIFKFATQWLELSQDDKNFDVIMSMYDETVDFYKLGRIRKKDLASDKQNYFISWPQREYKLVSINSYPRANEEPNKISMAFSYVIRNAEGKTKEGLANCLLLLNNKNGSYVITSEKRDVSFMHNDTLNTSLIASWLYGYGPECYETYSKELDKVIEQSGEEAYLTTCWQTPSTYLLLIRPATKRKVEVIDESKHFHGIRVVDLDNDGTSEIVADQGHSDQGVTEGSKYIFSLNGWRKSKLFETGYSSCETPDMYLTDYTSCPNGTISQVKFNFKDLDGDNILDLVETLAFDDVVPKKALATANTGNESNYKVLRERKIVNNYLFKNKKFIPFSN